jgi:predicted membrane channel-forming protein YqfA (hemolysin III family)
MPWLIGGLIYAGGAGIYALKIPERWFKRYFDIVGASH